MLVLTLSIGLLLTAAAYLAQPSLVAPLDALAAHGEPSPSASAAADPTGISSTTPSATPSVTPSVTPTRRLPPPRRRRARPRTWSPWSATGRRSSSGWRRRRGLHRPAPRAPRASRGVVHDRELQRPGRLPPRQRRAAHTQRPRPADPVPTWVWPRSRSSHTASASPSTGSRAAPHGVPGQPRPVARRRELHRLAHRHLRPGRGRPGPTRTSGARSATCPGCCCGTSRPVPSSGVTSYHNRDLLRGYGNAAGYRARAVQ